MATAPPVSTTAARGAPTPGVMHPLERLRGTIRRYVTLEGLAVVGVYLALWFWIGLALDFGVFKAFRVDWVQELPKGVRGGLLLALVLGLLAVVAVKVVRRLLVEFRPPALALVLERRFPQQLGDRLITAVELADLDRAVEQGYSRAMIEQTIADAVTRVETVPVNEVFNWGRLKRLDGWFLGLTLGVYLLVGFAYSMTTRTNPLADYAVRFNNVAVIWFERNVLLWNTIWPRQAHLVLLDFPESGDLRVGRDAPSPRLRVKAIKWLVADGTAPEGWRAATWDDLSPDIISDSPVPRLPTELLANRAGGPQAVAAAAASAVAAPPLVAPGIAAAAPAAEPPTEVWTLDRVNLLLDQPEVRQRLNDRLPLEDYTALMRLLEDTLPAIAAEPRMARRFRMLDVPDRVEVSYWGAKTSNDMPFSRGNDYEYAGALTDLRESVKFRIWARDYGTATRTITLVPPPMLTKLTRDEHQPAYLFHRAPLGSAPDGGPTALKGLKQYLPDRAVSLNGMTSQFTVPAGTDVDLSGLLDKELTSAVLRPRSRKGGDDAPLSSINLALADGHLGFTHRFPNVVGALDFDLEFTDLDNVSSRRHVLIEPVRDGVPKVNVMIDGIRKTGQGYVCTPVAMIPFAGTVNDNAGLDKIDYELTIQRLESAGVVGAQAAWAVGAAMHFAPMDPVSLLMGTATAGRITTNVLSTAPETQAKTLPLKTFEEVYRDKAQRDVLKAELLNRLKLPPPQPSPLVTQFDVRPQYEFLDLRDRLPDLKVKEEFQLQPRYRMRLTVSATDNNIETGPGVGPNKEPPFTVLVVSEAELLVEIAKEEQNLHFKLEDTVNRLRDARLRLEKVSEELPNIAAEQLPTMALRGQEVVDATAKGRDVVQEVFTDYSRILKEMEYNRVMPRLVEKVKAEIIFPMESILRREFVRAEEATDAYRKELDANRKPDADKTQRAKQSLDQLIDKLARVLDAMGDVTTLNKLIAMIRDIEKAQEHDIGEALKRMKAEQERILREKLKGLETP
jgi:hypothetical protein